MTKWVYSFGGGAAEGGADMRNLLGVLELPIFIVSTRKEGTKRAVGGFRLEVME